MIAGGQWRAAMLATDMSRTLCNPDAAERARTGGTQAQSRVTSMTAITVLKVIGGRLNKVEVSRDPSTLTAVAGFAEPATAPPHRDLRSRCFPVLYVFLR